MTCGAKVGVLAGQRRPPKIYMRKTRQPEMLLPHGHLKCMANAEGAPVTEKLLALFLAAVLGEL